MTGPIAQANSSAVALETPAPPPAARPPAASPPATAPATAGREAVTLSAEAPAVTRLFEAARASTGVDEANVQRIRLALQNGSYEVAPESLAAAITAAFKDRSS